MRRAAPTSTWTTSYAITTCFRRSAAPTDSTATTRSTAISSISRNCSARCRRRSRSITPTSWTPTREAGATTTSISRTGLPRVRSSSILPGRLCDICVKPVPLPREVEQYLHYFCGDATNPNALNETEALRVSFYKAAATFVRAFTAIAQDLTAAGYTDAEAAALRKEAEFYADIRSAIKKPSGEELDIKPYEADMRHLLNTYIQADPAANLGELGEMSLTELIVESGIHDAIARKLNQKGKLSKNAIAEGIINNVRKTIIRDQLTDPKFYAEMSKLLEDLIQQSRNDTAAYEKFLEQAEALVKRIAQKSSGCHPSVLNGH